MPALAAPYPKRFSVEPHGPTWRARWHNDPAGPGPKRGGEPFATQEDAHLFVSLATRHGLTTALNVVRGGATSVPPTAPVTGPRHSIGFTDLAELYSQQRTKASDRTRKEDLTLLHHHAVPYFGNTDITLIKRKAGTRGTAVNGPDGKPMTAAGFVNWLKTREALTAHSTPSGSLLAPKTVSNIVGAARAVFEYAADEDNPLIAGNPFRKVELPDAQDTTERPHLESTAYRALEEAINPYFVPLLAFLVGTGVRWGEVAGLQVRHVHLDGESPFVDIRLACRKGVHGGRTLGRLKSRSARRTIALSPRTVELLRPLIEGRAPLERAFVMRGGGDLHHSNFRDRFFMPAVQAAGAAIPEGFTIHGLRHTHATWLLNSNEPIFNVSRRMGHADIATTVRYYGHVMAQAQTAVLTVVDAHTTGQQAPESPTPRAPAPAPVDPGLYLAADAAFHLDRAGGEQSVDEGSLPELEEDDVAA